MELAIIFGGMENETKGVTLLQDDDSFFKFDVEVVLNDTNCCLGNKDFSYCDVVCERVEFADEILAVGKNESQCCI